MYLRKLEESPLLKTTTLLVFFLWLLKSSKTLDFLTAASNRTAKAFNRSRATRAVAIDISKAFDRVWYTGLLNIPKS